MTKDSKGIGATLLLVVRVSFRFGCMHPFVLSTLIFLLVLYGFFPSLFALFVSSSPVLVCTTVLLGFLLSYGEPNAPEDKRASETGGTASDLVGRACERTVTEAANACSMPKEAGRTEEQKIESSFQKMAEGARKTNGDASAKDGNKNGKGLKVEVDKPASDSCLDSSLGSPWQTADNVDDDCSVTSAESSSPDASITEVVPVLDELHPLLHANAPQSALKSVNNSDASSENDQESEEDDEDEDNAHDDDEEDEDAQEDKDDGNEKVVEWTEDDQKNLMDLGSSEVERNQRLENLIAKRSMRKRTLPASVTNLIDLDINDHLTPATAEDSSCFHVQIPPRRNPFDVPFDSAAETLGLPPLPGSAPPILLPRRNPFDLPFDQGGGFTAAAGPSHPPQFVPIPQRDPFFRRHESFSLGPTLPGGFKQYKRDSHFNPYFVPNKIEETGFPSLQRQLSDKSDSKLSSVAEESDTSSSVADEEHHKELLEEEGLHQESELLSHVGHDAEPVEQGSESSDSVDSVEANDEPIDTNIGDAHVIGLNRFLVTGATHQANDAGIGLSFPAKLEVIEDKYDDDSSSSSSSEMSEEVSNMSIPEESVSSEPARDDSSKVSSDSLPFPSKSGDGLDDVQVAEPVYDLSPSAAKKSLDADLFNAGKNGLNPSSCMASAIQANTSEAGSPPRPLGRNSSSEDGSRCTREDLVFPSGGLWVASPSLASVDKIESRSREISEIRERDVIQVELPGPREDFVRPVALALPRTISGRIINP